MKKDIKRLVKECGTCQVVKYKIVAPAGLLLPLPKILLSRHLDGLHRKVTHSSQLQCDNGGYRQIYQVWALCANFTPLHSCYSSYPIDEQCFQVTWTS